jgi:hypothetical protein
MTIFMERSDARWFPERMEIDNPDPERNPSHTIANRVFSDTLGR